MPPNADPAPRATGGEGDEPHLTPAWFALLERTALPADTEVSDLPVGPRERPDACRLPLMRLASHPWRCEALATCYSPIFGPIDAAHLDAAALRAAFVRIREDRDRPTAQLDLGPLDPDGPFFATALQALRAAGWIAGSYFRFGNWHARIAAPDFAAYLAARPSALCNTLRRAQRKLARRPDFALRIETEPGPALDRAIGDYATVYGTSWKRPEPWPDFIPGLCRLAAERGWLRLGVITLDRRPVASQLWLVAGGRAQIVKLAYDPAYRPLSVGTVLTAGLMRQVIERDRVSEIDYLIGDDSYKRDWTPLRRERHGIVAFNPASPRGLVQAGRHYGGRLLRETRDLPRLRAVFRRRERGE